MRYMGGRATRYGGSGIACIEGYDENVEVCFYIYFDVSGWSDPGITSGPADRCYPPEGDEERTITGCELEFAVNGGEFQTLGKFEPNTQEQDELWNLYGDSILNADFQED